MINDILNIFHSVVSAVNGFFVTALDGNVLVAGAATLAIGGTAYAISYKIPGRIVKIIKNRIFYAYTLHYTRDLGGAQFSPNANVVGLLGTVLERQIQKSIDRRRNFSELAVQNSRLIETMADGVVLTKFSGVWALVTRRKKNIEAKNASALEELLGRDKVELNITVARLNRAALMSYITTLLPSISKHGVYTASADGGCTRLRSHNKDNAVVLNDDVAAKIDKAIFAFLENYKNNPESRLTILIHGEPGNGKSTIAEYIAMKLNTSLFVIDGESRYQQMITSDISHYVTNAKQYLEVGQFPVILADDFEVLWAGLESREVPAAVGVKASDKNERVTLMSIRQDKSLFSLLRSLESPAAYTGAVVVMTTNHLLKLDKAIYRPGRVHLSIELKRLSPETIIKIYEEAYKRPWTNSKKPLEWRACDISDFKRDNGAKEFERMVIDPFQKPADFEILQIPMREAEKTS